MASRGRAEPAGREADWRLRAIVAAAHDSYIAMDAGGFITEWNPQAEATFGWARDEAVGQVLADLVVPPDLRERHWSGLRRFLSTGEGPLLGSRVELMALHRDGREFPVELTITAIDLEDQWEFHAFLHDISERRCLEAERSALVARLESLAMTDELTGLANRRAWSDALGRELARARREGAALFVTLLDLDDFKAFNDSRGHQAGDALLKQVASRWLSAVRATDVLARYGGEEFAFAFQAPSSLQARAVVERLRQDVPAGQTGSAGLARWDGNESAAALVARADGALYEAKRQGRNRTAVTGP